MREGASPGRWNPPVSGTPPGFLSTLLARSIISPSGLPSSPILWPHTPAPIPPHAPYVLILVIIQALFPLPTSLTLEASDF